MFTILSVSSNIKTEPPDLQNRITAGQTCFELHLQDKKSDWKLLQNKQKFYITKISPLHSKPHKISNKNLAHKLQQAINKQTNLYTTYILVKSGSKLSQQSLANELQQANNKQTDIYTDILLELGQSSILKEKTVSKKLNHTHTVSHINVLLLKPGIEYTTNTHTGKHKYTFKLF